MHLSPSRIVAPALAALALVVAGHAAHADPVKDYADALEEYTGAHSSSYALTKLTTFKLGAKCLGKLADKNNGALHAASFYTRDLAEYAKALTGDDWSQIETQNNNDREANRPLVEQAIDAFAPRLHITVSVEGDDCNATSNAMWLRYWSTIATSLRNFPPKAQAVTVTLDVKAKAKEVTVVVGKDQASFAITAPRDVEPAEWSDRIDKPFRKIVSELPDDFSFGVEEYTGRFHAAWVLTKLTKFKVGKKCWAKLPDKNNGALHAASFYTRDIAEYAKLVGGDDWDKLETQSINDPKTNRELAATAMDAFARRFSVTVSVDGDDCDAGQSSMWLKVWSQVAQSLKNYPPKSNKVAVTVSVTAKAKDLGVKVGKNGATIAITAPRNTEPADWTSKIDAALKKVARKP